MKIGTPDHPKTAALAVALGIELRLAIATLELLWHFTRRYAPRGDVGRWPNDEIARKCLWPGDPNVLVRALLDHHWLDPDSTHRLIVHDVEDHADESWKKTLKSKGLWFIEPDMRNGSAALRVPTPNDSEAIPNDSAEVVPPPKPSRAEPSQAESSQKSARGGSKKTQISEDFSLTPERRAYAENHRVMNIPGEFEKFTLHHRAHGSVMADWDAAWKTWVRRAPEFARTPRPVINENPGAGRTRTGSESGPTRFGDLFKGRKP